MDLSTATDGLEFAFQPGPLRAHFRKLGLERVVLLAKIRI
jgi:hypothetical protein